MEPTENTNVEANQSIADHPISDLYPDLNGSECQTPGSVTTSPLPDGFLDDLDNRDVLAKGELKNGSYTDRDRDRARILRFLSQHPEGCFHTHITSYVLKGVHPERAEWPTTNDADHRFVKRFLSSLEDARPHLVENRKEAGGWHATPTLALIDLITQGISQTHADREWIYDRDFAKSLLDSRKQLTDDNREHLESSFRRYVNRIENYRLLFDVFVNDGRHEEKRRMQKGYKTRFNSKGRVSQQIARFNQALESAFESADCAVLATLTTGPNSYDWRPEEKSILELTENINPAFNRLNQYLKSDPSTKKDTRLEVVPQYRADNSDSVTGRPRERLEYVKVLEFQENGLPHLHVLFFDPPRREKDGCPWLIDKQELEQKWKDYGMGQIVDVYPLTKRDDLRPETLRDLVDHPETQHEHAVEATISDLVEDTVENWYRDEHLDGKYFNTLEGRSGFVDWYRFGKNDLDKETIEEISRSHKIDMEGAADNPYQKTAGAYLCKYMSATFGSILDVADTEHEHESHTKAATWKLGLYWATNRRLWSLSEGLRRAIDRNDQLDDDVRRAVRWAAEDTIKQLLPDYADRSDLPDLDREKVEQRLTHTLRSPSVRIDFLGAYHYADIPATETTSFDLDDTVPFNERESGIELRSRTDRPPPVVDVWG